MEEKEVLTTAQQKYRNFMHNLMGWMKDTNNIAIVRPAAVSDLRYSHKNIVTGKFCLASCIALPTFT